MSSNLIDSVKDYLTPDLLNKASSYLGESSQGISKAAGIAVPTVLAAIVKRAQSGDTASILNNAKNAVDSNLLGNLNNLFSPGSSSSPGFSSLTSLFGNNTGNITNALSNFSGIKSSSANSLLSMISSLIFAILGKRILDNSLNPGGLTSLLTSQKASVMSALPAGLFVNNWFDSFKDTVGSTVKEMHAAVDPPKRNWLWPVIIVIAVVLALIYFMKGCNKSSDTVSTADTAVMAPPVVDTTTAMPQKESMMVKLANGTEINAYKGGIEDMLVQCLDDANCKPGKDKWFDFDNINFELNSAAITTESQSQINNIVAILKAYPKAQIKIGGYTDKTGDDAGNKKLSQDRADAVSNAIKAAGANTTQLVGAEGYGSEFAKVDASASDEERKTDRRISVQLREK